MGGWVGLVRAGALVGSRGWNGGLGRYCDTVWLLKWKGEQCPDCGLIIFWGWEFLSHVGIIH